MVAPVLISFFSRNEHFKKTVESLRKNKLSSETDLYIAIDYTDDIFVKNAQEDIIQYLSSLTGFKSVSIIKRDFNFGAYKNITEALHYLFGFYDCVILTEDDNEFSPLFLDYMNSNIENYKCDDDVYSVCAYVEPFINLDFFDKNKCFAREGLTSYGFCLWKDKYYRYKFSNLSIRNERKSVKNYLRLLRGLHYHVLSGLIYSAENDTFFSDYEMAYYIYVTGKKCIFPSVSLVRNIGQDGSGINSGTNFNLLNQEIFIEGKIDFNIDKDFDEHMRAILYRYHKRDILREIYYFYRFFRL